LIATPPAQLGSSALEAVQLVAFVDTQLSELLPPVGSVTVVAESVTVGMGAIATVTSTSGLSAAPAPSHKSLYVVVTTGETGAVPLVASPVSKSPLKQRVALVLLQLSWLVSPAAIVSRLAEMAAVTACPTVIVALSAALAPPAPRQVIE
jgi:hypothetical protein